MFGALRLTGVALAMACLLSGCSAKGGPLNPRGSATLGPKSATSRVALFMTARGPAPPGTTKPVLASCPDGSVVTGGGVSTLLIGGGMPPSSLHAKGTAPAAGSGSGPATSGATATGWSALGATGGQPVFGGATTSVAICLKPAPAKPPTVVVASVPGPETSATTALATASCPAGGRLLGGGGLTEVVHGSQSPSLHLIGSYPSGARGVPAADGTADVASWSALADAGGRTGKGVQTTAFAICAPTAERHTRIVSAQRPGPLDATADTTATAACPAPATLIGGGAKAGPEHGAPQQGLHLTGSFPSDPAGKPPWSSAAAAAAATSWSARAESGGQGSPNGTLTVAYAVCLQP